MYHRRAFEMLRLLLHPDLSRCFDERINRRARELAQRGTASSRMSCRRICIKQVDFFLQVNLDDFAVLACSGKMARSAAVKEDMKHDPIKGGILRMSVTFPIRNMHIPFHIPLAGSIAIDPNGGMNKVRSGFPVPESELNDFNQSSIGRSKSRPERSRIPERLPFELGPFFGDVPERFVDLQ